MFTLKSAAIALVVLAGTVGTAFAGYAEIDDTTKVRDEPYKWADVIGYAKEGKKVWVGDCENGFCYIEQKKGKDGWVRKSDLDFYKKGKDVDVEFCFGGILRLDLRRELSVLPGRPAAVPISSNGASLFQRRASAFFIHFRFIFKVATFLAWRRRFNDKLPEGT